MVWSKEGFLIPVVNPEQCIYCGLCVKMCPAQPRALRQQHYHDKIDKVIAYGGWNRHMKIHQNSSSGGVFSALAERVFSVGGCVFGVVWQDKETAVFAKAENMEELAPMRGSKYTQAIPGSVYRDVKAELARGRQVLFTGTACQVYALKKHLCKPYESLLTFDIVCHGVPSRKLLQAYVKHYEHEQRKELKEIYFRYKDGNWQGYKVQKRFIDGSVVNHVNSHDMFMGLFIGDYVLNQACYNCPHAHLPRPGDLTLGDFWGNLHSLHPNWPISDGIGSLIANSEKGQEVLESLAFDGKITLHKEPFQNLYNGQPRSYLRGNETRVSPDRDEVIQMLNVAPISKVYEKYHNSITIGSLRIRKNGVIHKTIVFPRRIASFLKRKLFIK